LGEAIPVIKDIMLKKATAKLPWRVPLTCDIELGHDWTVPWNLTKIEFGKDEMPPELAKYITLESQKSAAPPTLETPVVSPPAFTNVSELVPVSQDTHVENQGDGNVIPLPTIPTLGKGEPFVYKVSQQDLSTRLVNRLATTIRRCSGRGPHLLKIVVAETGESLWEGTDVFVNPLEVTVLMNMPEV
jgi:hypothetical protein